MFHFSSEILNAPSEKITFLWNRFVVSAIFTSVKQVLMKVSNISGFFLGIISWKGASLFSGGSLFFS